jgi:(1->4)-alpha-D-glucan 1-alpha-D-glucosylmutase
LLDPAGYFRDLQRAAFLARCRADLESQLGREWGMEDVESSLAEWWDRQAQVPHGRAAPGPIYLIAEKILEPGEHLPPNWPVHGTTGYEFARVTTGLFVDPANRAKFDELYRRFTGRALRYDDLVYETKKLIMRVALASEVNVLALAADRISEHQRTTRDFTLNGLRFALREIIACFPVYRTYIVCDEGTIPERDRHQIEVAVGRARRRNPASDVAVFDFLRDLLLQRFTDRAGPSEAAEQCRFVMKFQQLTGPVMAKGVEDTAFYIYNRLSSLNEVGGDPTKFGVSVEELHRGNEERARHWPHAMLASSTHDTKRSEDVRARIDVLSEVPREWRGAINRWARLNRRHKTKIEGVLAPDRNDEYLLYQTVLGAWPFEMDVPDAEFTERILEYMLKAIHEAQVHTSWVNPNQEYDAAMARFVRGALGPDSTAFQADFEPLRRRVARIGAVNGLAQHLLKLTAPGVPDLYQGTELWDFSLVDPDNRRPVDFERRRALLSEVIAREPSAARAAELLAAYPDGRIKLYLTVRALSVRRAMPDLFRHGAYMSLAVDGKLKDHAIAFARWHASGAAIVVVPRLVAALSEPEAAMPVGDDVWAETRVMLPEELSGRRYRDVLTGVEHSVLREERRDFRLADLLGTLPCALLERVDAEQDAL